MARTFTLLALRPRAAIDDSSNSGEVLKSKKHAHEIFFFESNVLNNRNSLTCLWLLRDLNTLSDTCKYDCFFSYLPNGNRQIQPRVVVEALHRNGVYQSSTFREFLRNSPHLLRIRAALLCHTLSIPPESEQ